MGSFLVLVGLVLIWGLVIRLATVRRFRASSRGQGNNPGRPGIGDYEKTLKWFSEYLEPHVMFLAAIAVGLFTYRLAQTQNKILERQVAMDESRQPVTFHFKRSESYDYKINGVTERIIVRANKGYVANLNFGIKHELLLDIGTRTNENVVQIDRVIRVRVDYLYDYERMYMDGLPNMSWSAEDGFQRLQKVVEDAQQYLLEAYGRAETSFRRSLTILVTYTAFDLNMHTDCYVLTMWNFDGKYEEEFNDSQQVSKESWDKDYSVGTISMLHENWEETAAELREIIDERMSLPEATPQGA